MQPRTICINSVTIKTAGHVVMVGGKDVELTYTQFKILYLLMSNQNKKFSDEQILKSISGGSNQYLPKNIINTHIKRVNEKMGGNYIKKTKDRNYQFTVH